MSGSKRFQFNGEDLRKVGKGALIAGAGALLTYAAEWASETDFGDMTPVIVALASFLVNAGWKWLRNYEAAALILLLLLPADGFGQTKEIEAQPYDPIMISVDLGLEDGESAVTFWRSAGKAQYREVNDGRDLAVWAPPGKHSIWMGATVTKQTTTTITDGNGKEIEVVTGVSTRKVEFDYLITVHGSQPPPDPVDPEEPVVPDPVKPTLTGPAYHVIIRHIEELTVDQQDELILVRNYANVSTDVQQLEFDYDAERRPASTYVARIPDDASLPYSFVVRTRKDNGEAYISWQGEFESAESTIAEIQKVLK